jgi:hypothetical protein
MALLCLRKHLILPKGPMFAEEHFGGKKTSKNGQQKAAEICVAEYVK